MNMAALSAYMAAASQQRARLGHLDCVRFVAEALLIGWGRDFRHSLHYSDRRSAVLQLRRAGGLYEAICETLGQDIPATDLRPGDIAWFPDPSVGLVLPACIAVKGYRTVFRVPLEVARSGWKTDGTAR